MAKETHIVEISSSGEVQITVKGLKGSKCLDATKQVEEALGRKTSSAPTGEFYEREPVKVSQ